MALQRGISNAIWAGAKKLIAPAKTSHRQLVLSHLLEEQDGSNRQLEHSLFLHLKIGHLASTKMAIL